MDERSSLPPDISASDILVPDIPAPDTEPEACPDPWERLRRATPARIGLDRSGAGMPTRALNAFRHDAARARDAVHAPLDTGALREALAGFPLLELHSAAADRSTYLRRPDLGRRLCDADRERLSPADPAPDLVFVICDGLSSAAISAHAAPFLKIAAAGLTDLRLGPVAIVREGRVAVGDEIGARLGAGMIAVLIGERPGLTVADSMGLYLTWGPRPGRQDSERNCLSNIHLHGGQSYEGAAAKLIWLIREARRRGLTGTGLKEEAPALPGRAGTALPKDTPAS